MRGIAIMLVLLLHFGFFSWGWIGVQIFFVLSGFLITRILYNARHQPLTKYFGRFYRNRVLRIFPLYFGYLAIVALFLAPSNNPYFSRNWPFLLTFTVNLTRHWHDWKFFPIIGHLWTLAVEEQFYLVWPFFVRLMNPKYLIASALLFIVASPVFRLFYGLTLRDGVNSAFTVGDTIYWNTLSQIDAFAIGGLVAIISIHGIYLGRIAKLFLPVALLTLITGLANVVLISVEQGTPTFFSTMGYALNDIRDYQYVWSYTLLNMTTATCIAYLAANKSKQGKSTTIQLILSNRILREIGKVSYGMYIFHQAIVPVFFKLLPPILEKLPRVPIFLLYVCVVYLVAFVSFKFFETQFLRYKSA